jgi:hypothetical protein
MANPRVVRRLEFARFVRLVLAVSIWGLARITLNLTVRPERATGKKRST